MIPKIKPLRSPRYLSWLRKKPCCMCGNTETVQAHHHHTGGMGIKGTDISCVPLCASCHHEEHHKGRSYFWNLDRLCLEYLNEFLATGNRL